MKLKYKPLKLFEIEPTLDHIQNLISASPWNSAVNNIATPMWNSFSEPIRYTILTHYEITL